MAKNITINESKVNNLIEQTINELDWKTYMNAAKKVADRASEHEEDKDQAYYDNSWRKRAFRNAAEKSYMQKHNAQNDFGRLRSIGDGWEEDEGTPDEDIWYGVTDTYFPSMDDDDVDVESKYAENYDSNVFADPVRNRHFTDHMDDTLYSEEELNTLSPEFNDVYNYKHGKSKYTKGKGWNEAVLHTVTENVLRVIKEDAQDKIIAKAFMGRVVHTPWAGNQKIQKVEKDVDEDGTPVLVFSGMGLPFMNLTYDEASCLLEDGVMDNIDLVDFQNESIVHAVTEKVIKKINEEADPFEHIQKVWDGVFQSYKEGLFDGLGLDKYLEWKMNGETNLPPITREEAHNMLDAVSDKMEELWNNGQGSSDLDNQLAHIEDDLTDIVQML